MSVTLKHITKIFKDPNNAAKEFTAVKDVNLDVHEGEMVTFLGPSGCGKTTTLRVISGFESPTAGEVWISGKMVNNDPPNKRDTSMVFQSYAIFPHLSVSQNIGFGLDLKGISKKEIRTQVETIMEVMNLKDLYNRRPDQLSGGQQQRVALARAIINKPKVLLFDEPLSNLDAKLRDQMRIEIRRIQQTFGITSIYVTHDQDEAMTVSDRIMVMNEGEVMQIGTPFEIYSRPANTFVSDFIGRVNFFPATVISAGADGVVVKCFGQQRVIPSWNGEFVKDEQVNIVLRPESLILGKLEAGKPFAKGVIKRSVYLGPTVEYEIELEGMDALMLAVTYNPVKEGFYRDGEKIQIDFDPVSAHVLPR
jgi:iron(III) transport system ATP-binding protein